MNPPEVLCEVTPVKPAKRGIAHACISIGLAAAGAEADCVESRTRLLHLVYVHVLPGWLLGTIGLSSSSYFEHKAVNSMHDSVFHGMRRFAVDSVSLARDSTVMMQGHDHFRDLPKETVGGEGPAVTLTDAWPEPRMKCESQCLWAIHVQSRDCPWDLLSP